MGRETIIRSGTEKVLFDEEWKTERVINRLRMVIWLGAGTIALIGNIAESGRMDNIAPLVSLTAGIAAILFEFLYLRNRFHRAFSTLMITLDLGVFTLIMHTVYAAGKTPSVALGLGLIVATNVLRFSPWSAIYAVFLSWGSFLLIHALHVHNPRDPQYVTMAMEPFLIASIGGLAIYAGRKFRAIIRRVKERDAFARFLPGPVVDRLTRNPLAVSLRGEEHEASVLFADIREFTALSDKLAPGDVVALLNEYFAEMVDEIFKHEGVLDKFIGDGICAVFGAPITGENPARRALQCGLGMIERLKVVNAARLKRGEQELRIGIGIHSGKLVAGSIGSPLRMEYTHIGDTVNTASRIEGLCKPLQQILLSSRETFERAGGARAFAARALEPVAVKGKPEPLQVYAIEAALA